MGSARQQQGFTLLEIIVVVALIGTTLFVIVPRFAVPLTADPARHASRWILNTIGVLKREAVHQQQRFTLHIDVAANRLRVTRDRDAASDEPAVAETVLDLKPGARLVAVEYPRGRTVAADDTKIRFFPQGYSDRAIIHLAADGHRRFSFRVEPFLASAKLVEGTTGFGE